MKKTLSVTLALAGAILTDLAAAEPMQMRPGLWEHRYTIQSQSGEMERSMQQMQEQLADMPPEQRKMMEQMMAGQGMGMGPTMQTMRVCISKEKAERGIVPQQDGNCSQDIVGRSGNTTRFKFHCAGTPPSSGEGEITISSPTTYNGKSTVRTSVNGKPDTLTMEQTGKWLSSDCGNIRPRK